jgi:hypothetical protein
MTQRIVIDMPMLDIPSAKLVEVSFVNDRLWVNINGECALRIYRIKELSVVDNRARA